ncbi:hypothetical protein WHZ77_04925 [Bradyrhizobium sp. A5]|uniref:hypothetical protein n=1 Tax=Bradyrhizobium sp. A5 TaxID=3133696 RepID=UPI00324EB850
MTKSVAGAALVHCAGFAAIAIGSGASVGADNAVALGNTATASGANAFAVGATALLHEGKSHAVIANAGGGIGLERNVAGGRGAVSLQW